MIKALMHVDYLKRIFPYLLYFFPAYTYTIFKKYQKNKKYGHIWLICERGDEARDNSYHLFKYIRTNHPDLSVFYVITKNSPDFEKVSRYGNIIEHNSFFHFVYFILSRTLISTHMYGAMPYGKVGKYVLWLMPKKKHIFLQHGVTKDKLIIRDTSIDLIVCSSEKEKELLKFSPPSVFKNIRILGLCRYDSLVDNSKNEIKKIILIMPTFRFWLERASKGWNSKALYNDPFFTNWNELLNDHGLIEYIEKNEIDIIFYPHYRAQKFLSEFHSNSKNVIIANNSMYDVQELINRSSIMVTDYSSVFFDFAYLKKPIAYFHFDYEKYRLLQYPEGSFSYDQDGFGPVFYNSSELANYLKICSSNKFSMEIKYLTKVESYYVYLDQDNTKRNYEAIVKMN